MILSLIIPVKRKSTNLQVYLAPLIEELHIMWQGIDVEDKSRVGRQKKFNLKAILMWTMHDYPRYGDVFCLSVSGHHACPPCGMSLKSRSSKHLHKVVYEGHQKYFDKDNPKCRNVVEPKPKVWKAKDWYDHWMTCEPNKKKKIPIMKALNCFHTLPYWHHLLINPLLDRMDIFKNVACLIWEHITGKCDTDGQCRDLEDMHIKEHL